MPSKNGHKLSTLSTSHFKYRNYSSSNSTVSDKQYETNFSGSNKSKSNQTLTNDHDDDYFLKLDRNEDEVFMNEFRKEVLHLDSLKLTIPHSNVRDTCFMPRFQGLKKNINRSSNIEMCANLELSTQFALLLIRNTFFLAILLLIVWPLSIFLKVAWLISRYLSSFFPNLDEIPPSLESCYKSLFKYEEVVLDQISFLN